MAKHNYIEALPADAVKLDYQGVELYITPKGDVFKRGRRNRWLHCSPSHNGKCGHAQITVKTKQTDTGAFRIDALVHRLVALAFIPNPDNHPCVCHRDETLDSNGFLDNSVENLWWGSYKDNMADKTHKGRHSKGSARPLSKLLEKDIPVIRQLYAAGKKQTEIAEIYGVYQQIISNIINNKSWKHI